VAKKKASRSGEASWSINKENMKKLDKTLTTIRTAVKDLDLGLKTLDKMLDGPHPFRPLIQFDPQGRKARPKSAAGK
jgi:hypothetical protein